MLCSCSSIVEEKNMSYLKKEFAFSVLSVKKEKLHCELSKLNTIQLQPIIVCLQL